MSIHEKLALIQSALKAPKSQYNEFGRYKYRKNEDILESAKPLCKDVHAAIIQTDELVLIGDRYYIKATSRLIDTETGEYIETTAYAREEEEKKGLDGSQITGSSSSYARKYSLNGLFAIDDTVDSDTTNVGDSRPSGKPAGKPTAKQQKVAQKADNGTDEQKDLLPGGKNYEGIIKAFATGRTPKSGGDYRTAWIRATNAGPELVEVFDHDVATYRLEHNIQPAFQQ